MTTLSVHWIRGLATAALILAFTAIAAPVAFAQERKPNILVIFGDDIGMWNVGAYTHGMMGRTPNIDSIGKEGMLFTDHYGQPSCTAGRAAFIMGQLPLRTGMTTIGIPGSTRGIQKIGSDARRSAQDAGLCHRRSSARTISATAMSSCRPCMASTNGSATSITSTRKRSRKNSTIPARRTREYLKKMWAARRAAHLGDRHGRSDRPTRSSAASASRRSRTPAR